MGQSRHLGGGGFAAELRKGQVAALGTLRAERSGQKEQQVQGPRGQNSKRARWLPGRLSGQGHTGCRRAARRQCGLSGVHAGDEEGSGPILMQYFTSL